MLRVNQLTGFGGKPASDTGFQFTMATTGAAETVTIPCQNVGTFSAEIDWGDGTTSTITTYNDADLAHTYASAGDHAIKISGTFPNIYFNNAGDKLKLKSVEQFGVVGWTSMFRAFYGCSNMASFTGGTTDTSAVTRMDLAFRGCSGLTTLDLTSFNTAASTTFAQMLRDCTGLTSLDLSSFDTAAATTLDSMFYNSSGLTDIIGIDAFDIEGLDSTSSLNNIATFVTLPTSRYDALLIAWDAQNPFDGMAPNFGSSKYTAGGAAATARANLISTDSWTITDGGTA